MSTWDDKPNDYEHALQTIERLQAAIKLCDAALTGYCSHAYSAAESHQQLQAAWKACRELRDVQQGLAE